jgi:prepilin-type N-terminal cleavage/methylation domain-containing protein
MSKQDANRLRNSGFSMLEVLIVLAGAAILAAIAVPLLSQMASSYDSVFAAQQVSTQLSFARLKAISGNESLRVHFPDASSYQVELSDGTVLRGPFSLPRDVSFDTASAGNGVTFPGRYATFQPDGSLPATGNGSAGRVRLLSRDGLHVDVIVDRGGTVNKTPTYMGNTAPF